MRAALRTLAVVLLVGGTAAGVWAQALPPPPTAYFNDYAGAVSADDARRLDDKLRQFDQQTSTQVVVAVFRALPSASLEDFTVRTAESWRVGRKALDNGAILFVFVDDRRMRIEVGYGLEGALPDALAFRILEEQVKPRFRTGDYAGGLEAGIDGIIAATRGEYTAPPPPRRRSPYLRLIVVVVIILLVLLLASPGYAPVGRTYDRRGSHRDRYWGGGWGGGGWTSGGGGGWSGGGFSGGGGSFGGGGASSSW